MTVVVKDCQMYKNFCIHLIYSKEKKLPKKIGKSFSKLDKEKQYKSRKKQL